MARNYRTYFLHIDCSPPTPGPSTPRKADDYLQDIEDLVGRRVANIADPTDERPFYRITFEFKKRESLNHAVCELIENMPELARRQSEADWIVYHIVGPVEATTALAETGGG